MSQESPQVLSYSNYHNYSTHKKEHVNPKIEINEPLNSTFNSYSHTMPMSFCLEKNEFNHTNCHLREAEGIYQCSLCMGLREVCPRNRIKIRKEIASKGIHQTFGKGGIEINSLSTTNANQTQYDKNIHFGKSLNFNESRNRSFSQQGKPNVNWFYSSNTQKGNANIFNNQTRVSRIIEEIHFVPHIHNVIVPQVIVNNRNSVSEFHNAAADMRKSISINIKENQRGRSAPITPYKGRRGDENIMTPKNLRKLAESIIR